MRWYNCHECEAEFRVVCDSSDEIEFCPCCGATLEEPYDEESDDLDDNDRY